MILDKGTKHSNSLRLSPVDWDATVSVPRVESSYEDLSCRFLCKERNFGHQYAHIYAGRLSSMQDAVKQSCRIKWGEHIPIRKLSELVELRDERCIIIGTIYKHQDLKPSILKEISEENQLVPQPKRTNYVSSSDQLILEDEIQRIRLLGNIDINKLVSGIVIAVIGVETKHGHFEVEDYVFGNLKVDVERPLHCLKDTSYVLFLSGLDIEGAGNILSFQLLIDWIDGELGCPEDQQNQRKLCRIIIAGNSTKKSNHTSDMTLGNSEEQEYKNAVSSIQLLDKLLLNLVKTIDVDIMPGEFDPSNYTLPQQPIHHCIFPKCAQYQTLHRVTNPYECIVQGRRILGTAGQPINDIHSLSDYTETISILESTLLWNHVAPTAPDTLACYPYHNEDPFIITHQPDIYFAGNMSTFETKIIHMNDRPVRLVCVPAFAESQTCTLVDLKTLDCHPLQFKVFQGYD